MLIDSHCHLDYLMKDEAVDPIVARAHQAGVSGMVTISTKLSTFPQVRALADGCRGIWCTVGVHPHNADEEGQESPTRLLELSKDERVIGIGETGLDYYYDNAPREDQQRSFRSHIEAARESGLPLIVHTRDADDDTVAILRESYRDGAFPGLIHCFTASRALADAVLELGFYLSVSGIITFKKAEAIRETLRYAPLDRLLVETDSPFLAPVPLRGKTNEPAYVCHTAKALADLKGIPLEAVEKATTENFFRLFTKARIEEIQVPHQ